MFGSVEPIEKPELDTVHTDTVFVEKLAVDTELFPWTARGELIAPVALWIVFGGGRVPET